VLLALDYPAVEAVAEKVPGSRVLLVEALRIAAVEQLHPRGQVGTGAFEDEVVVVAHQAEGVHGPAIPADGELEERQEKQAVEIVEVDPAAVDTPGRDVEEAVRLQAAGHTWHAVDGSVGDAEKPRRAEVVPLLLHFLDSEPRLVQPRQGTVP
jgi:hypothetical protein